MAKTSADNQFVKVYDQGGSVLNPTGEIKNQQLNEALAAGTVESILMKTGYAPQLSYHVVVKQNIDDFLRRADVDDILKKASFDFGFWQGWTSADKRFQLKRNKVAKTATTEAKPHLGNLTEQGEIVVDNWQGAIWTRQNWVKPYPAKTWTKLKDERIAKIDAGTINGWEVNMHVQAGDVLTKKEIIDLVNSMFIYNKADGSLTIKKL